MKKVYPLSLILPVISTYPLAHNYIFSGEEWTYFDIEELSASGIISNGGTFAIPGLIYPRTDS